MKMLNITLDDLCLRYYQYHPTGGSLHVLLDDNNVSDAILAFCENNCIENSDPCGQLIVDFFWDMDERERSDFVEKGLYKKKPADLFVCVVCACVWIIKALDKNTHGEYSCCACGGGVKELK